MPELFYKICCLADFILWLWYK